MKTLLIYLAGACTPFVVALICAGIAAHSDYREKKRYQRAWDKFGAEWDAMSFGDQTDFIANRPSYEPQYGDNKSAWFAHRWQYGHTKEI